MTKNQATITMLALPPSKNRLLARNRLPEVSKIKIDTTINTHMVFINLYIDNISNQ